MEKLMELRVHLRDLVTHTELGQYNQVEWVDHYNERIGTSMQQWLGTLGGTIMITGTPEFGRVTVYRTPSDPSPIIDTDWWTEIVNP